MSPSGRDCLPHWPADFKLSARQRKKSFDVEMRIDVIGERIERAFYPAAVRLIRHRNIQSRQKCFPEGVRGKQPVQVAAMDAPIW